VRSSKQKSISKIKKVSEKLKIELNMSFAKPERVINEGDTIILYIGINNMHAIEVKKHTINKHGQKV
jgi:ribosomal 50S subunit-recycling heat shock protein